MYEKDERISHLSEMQIEELMNEYYGEGKAKELIRKYNINVPISKLYTLFPPMECKDEKCEYCKTNLYEERQSKTNTNRAYSWNKPIKYCFHCGHVYNGHCNCNSCLEKRKVEEERLKREREEKIRVKKEMILKNFSLEKHSPKKMDDLSMHQKIYLGALMQISLSEDMLKIQPLYHSDKILAPSEEYCKEIICELYENEIIVVDPTSDLEAFSDDGKSFDMYRCTFLINFEKIVLEENTRNIFNGNIGDIDENICLEIWKNVALEESIEYLLISMQKVKFDFTPGKKTRESFRQFLDSYSVSQIYPIIYANIAKATKYYQEGSISRRQAANSVITNCQSYYERAVSEKWELKKYFRDKDCKESELSKYFFGKIIKIGDDGFNSKPTLGAISIT